MGRQEKQKLFRKIRRYEKRRVNTNCIFFFFIRGREKLLRIIENSKLVIGLYILFGHEKQCEQSDGKYRFN